MSRGLGRIQRKALQLLKEGRAVRKNGWAFLSDLAMDVFHEENDPESRDAPIPTNSQMQSFYRAIRKLEKTGYVETKKEATGFMHRLGKDRGGSSYHKLIKLTEKNKEEVETPQNEELTKTNILELDLSQLDSKEQRQLFYARKDDMTKEEVLHFAKFFETGRHAVKQNKGIGTIKRELEKMFKILDVYDYVHDTVSTRRTRSWQKSFEPNENEFADHPVLCKSPNSEDGTHGRIEIDELYDIDDLQNDGGYVPRGEKCPYCDKWVSFNSADSEEMDCMIETINDRELELNKEVIDRFEELEKRTGRTAWRKLLKH